MDTLLDEDGKVASTDTLQQWNRPKPLKVKPVPTYEMHLEKPKPSNPNPAPVKGKHPAEYELDKVCDSDIKHAKTLIEDLKQYERTTGEQVCFLHTLDQATPVASTTHITPVSTFLENFNKELTKLKKYLDPMETKREKLVDLFKMAEAHRKRIEEGTRDQASSWTWRKCRRFRLTASNCHRTITFTGRTSGNNVVKSIVNPQEFQNAATLFGKENEQRAIDRYKVQMCATGVHVEVQPCCLFIQTEKGYLAATPDDIVHVEGQQDSIIEVKCPASCTN